MRKIYTRTCMDICMPCKYTSVCILRTWMQIHSWVYLHSVQIYTWVWPSVKVYLHLHTFSSCEYKVNLLTVCIVLLTELWLMHFFSLFFFPSPFFFYIHLLQVSTAVNTWISGSVLIPKFYWWTYDFISCLLSEQNRTLLIIKVA